MGFFGDIWNSIAGSGGSIGNALTGGAMGLVTQGLGSLFGSKGPSQKELMQMQYDQQKKLMELQADLNRQQAEYSHGLSKEMWEYTNYENQKKHLEKANLNPALLYAKGGQGGNTAGAGAADGVGIPNPINPTMALEWKAMKADIKLKEAEATRITAETKKTEKETGKTEAETGNIETSKEEILQRVRGYKADNEIKEFEAWVTQLKRNSVYWENGKETTYEQAFVENMFKELKLKGIALDTEEKKLLNEKGIAERLAKDLNTLARGEFAEATEKIERSKKAKNETKKSFWDAERTKWELEQDAALSKLIENVSGEGEYTRLLLKILKIAL